MSLLTVALAVIVGLPVFWISTWRWHRRFTLWRTRDRELQAKWYKAYQRGDFTECRRLTYVARKEAEMGLK